MAEGAMPERESNHEMPVNKTGILESQDIGVVEACHQPDFLAEIVEEFLVHQMGVVHLERHADPLDRVECPVDVGKRPLCEPPLDRVLAQFLPRSEHESILVFTCR